MTIYSVYERRARKVILMPSAVKVPQGVWCNETEKVIGRGETDKDVCMCHGHPHIRQSLVKQTIFFLIVLQC